MVGQEEIIIVKPNAETCSIGLTLNIIRRVAVGVGVAGVAVGVGVAGVAVAVGVAGVAVAVGVAGVAVGMCVAGVAVGVAVGDGVAGVADGGRAVPPCHPAPHLLPCATPATLRHTCHPAPHLPPLRRFTCILFSKAEPQIFVSLTVNICRLAVLNN